MRVLGSSRQDRWHTITVKLITDEKSRRAASASFRVDFRASIQPGYSSNIPFRFIRTRRSAAQLGSGETNMAVGAKIAKTADRKKVMDTSKSTDCPKCGKSTRIVKRMKDRERGVPGGIYISCSACDFFETLSRISISGP